ncbi:MAG: YdbL family protein [Candidatus Omnitrophica bacterium]|nr:YdbL family protein [Candidatus Omnitrophota bacterium]
MRNLKILGILMISAAALTPLSARAEAKYSLKEMTPEVSAALDARRARFDNLADLKSKGMVGEDDRGYVKALVSAPEVEGVVEAENKDRTIVYTTIAGQNNLAGEIATIEKVFAEVQRDKAKPGEKIQADSGQWVTK